MHIGYQDGEINNAIFMLPPEVSILVSCTMHVGYQDSQITNAIFMLPPEVSILVTVVIPCMLDTKTVRLLMLYSCCLLKSVSN